MYILDTDILIYGLKGHPQVSAHLERHLNDSLAMSVISLMELYFGAHRSRHIEANLARVRALEKSFTVLEAGVEIAATFGSLKARLASEGDILDDFDLVIAATALAHNGVLVTNNVRHFGRVDGLRLANWTAFL